MVGAANSINEATTGIVGFTGTAFTATPVTNHAVIVGAGTSSTLTNLTVGVTGSVLQGASSADPAFTTTPTLGASNSGATNTTTITNPSNTASSSALLNITVGGTSAGDAFTTYTVSGTTNWSQGVDNSDSDAYVLAASTSLGTTNVMRAQTTGEINYPLQTAFMAFKSAQTNNVTGNGADYTVIFDTEVFDQNADYDNSTGTFTAPVTGRYQFDSHVTIVGCTIATTYELKLTTSNRTYDSQNQRAAGGQNFGNGIGQLTDMDSADTCTVVVNVTGEAGNTNILFGSSTLYTVFSGFLAC